MTAVFFLGVVLLLGALPASAVLPQISGPGRGDAGAARLLGVGAASSARSEEARHDPLQRGTVAHQ